MKRLFEYFQKFSVGLEQMLLDLSIYDGSHLENFKMLENLIGGVSYSSNTNVQPHISCFDTNIQLGLGLWI